jgi:hypothetical protein
MIDAGSKRQKERARLVEGACRECFSRSLEANVREAVALLDAIAIGEMLVRPPAGSRGEAQHAAAEALLGVIHKRLVDGLNGRGAISR